MPNYLRHETILSAVKRGIYTVNSSLIIRAVGKLSASDQKALNATLRRWLGL